MRKALTVGVAVALLVGAGSAFARGSQVKSKVFFDGVGELHNSPPPGQDSYVYGHVESKRAACLAKRTVVVKAVYDTEDSFRLYGGGKTGTHGGFDAIGPATHNGHSLTGVAITLKSKKVGTTKCKGDKVVVVE